MCNNNKLLHKLQKGNNGWWLRSNDTFIDMHYKLSKSVLFLKVLFYHSFKES